MDGNFSPGLVWSAVLLTSVLTLCSATLEPYDLLYDTAVRAFSTSDYERVVRFMEAALSSHGELRSTTVRCRLRCLDQHPFDGSFSDLSFFNVVLHRAACMNECMEEKLGPQSLHKISEDVVQDFNRRIPYNYLQMAYQKLKQPEKAAAAAHTYFQANPEHVEMGEDLEQYKDLQGVTEEHFVDREARPHQRAFTKAVKLYDKGHYEEAIVLFEEALEEYYKADVNCRALCQGPQKFDGHNHLMYKSCLITDHFTQVLHCEHECVRDLATRPGRLSPMENYLPLHYDYLQFAYFKVGWMEDALQCALTYLLFHKGEEFMTDNVEYYREVLGQDGESREVRVCGNVLLIVCINAMLLLCPDFKLLFDFSLLPGFPLAQMVGWSTFPLLKRKMSWSFRPSSSEKVLCHVCIVHGGHSVLHTSQTVLWLFKGGPLVYNDVRLVLDSVALNGTQRVLLDHVISEEECAELQQLAYAVTMAGDGYRGRMSPHTPNEKFEGATVLKTLQYGYEGRVPLRSARLFYDASERARRIIESYFMLNSTLHFSYTHLVCRTAITGQQDHRNDLSHPIHADNCLLDPEANECWKEPPAYTYRDYSALLYLNGDFEGGEFIFTEMDAKTVTASVKPRCGRLVGFSSGGENPHGVKAVTSGQRCAVALWFTLDPLFRELERLQADEVILALDTQSVWGHGLNINPKDEL
uniref:procollagen-proline 3-dioxygenase n=1 Tax=Gouania willdenowi TaxID=441366 RepID=A0A8C5I4P7_GOUWI